MRLLATGLAFAVVCSVWAQSSPKPVSGAGATFSKVPEAVSDSMRFAAPLGAFDAADIDGRRWRLVDFTGKVTVVNIWATTCGPCIKEHPEIQRFYDKWKASDTVQVVTFSIDREPAAVKAYMAKRKYTFPVIVNDALAEKLFSNVGIPQTWVVDRRGFRSEQFTTWSLGRIFMEAERLAIAGPKSAN